MAILGPLLMDVRLVSPTIGEPSGMSYSGPQKRRCVCGHLEGRHIQYPGGCGAWSAADGVCWCQEFADVLEGSTK